MTHYDSTAELVKTHQTEVVIGFKLLLKSKGLASNLPRPGNQNKFIQAWNLTPKTRLTIWKFPKLTSYIYPETFL